MLWLNYSYPRSDIFKLLKSTNMNIEEWLLPEVWVDNHCSEDVDAKGRRVCEGQANPIATV